MHNGRPIFGLRTTITLLVCLVVALSLLVTDVLISQRVAEHTQQNLADKATDIARIVAHSPLVKEALNGKKDQQQIQDFANEIKSITGVQFVVVMDMNKIRKSHPNKKQVGQPFVGGDEELAMKGQEYTSVAKGTLGMSLRAFSPVFTPEGKQVGAVAVGISLNNVQKAVERSRIIIYVGIGIGFLVGLIGAIVLAAKIKQTLFGLEPYAIAKLLEERSAMLESVREGVLAVDKDACITLVNAEAARLFKQAGVTGDLIGKNVEECIPNTRLKEVLETGQAELNCHQNLNGIRLLTNRIPVTVKGKVVGAVATFRDKTELRQLAEQLIGVRSYAEALRAQAHEFMNKLHVILGMAHMKNYEQLVAYISQISNQQQAEVGFVVRLIKDPVLAGFLLGKLSFAREVGAELELLDESFLPEPAEPGVIHELITVVGNLVDNALEAVADSPRKYIGLDISYSDGILTIEVSDTGPGIEQEARDRIFTKGFSTKADNRGFGLFLVNSSIEKLNGDIQIYSEAGSGTTFIVHIPYKSKGELND